MGNFGTKTSSRILIVVISLIVIVALGIAALVLTLYNPVGEMGEKEIIRENISSYEDKGHSHVWEYLVDFGIGDFDYRKFGSIENMVEKNYVGDLPSHIDMAIEAAGLYLDYLYDEDIASSATKEEITNNLLRAYIEATGDRYAAYRTYEELLEYMEDMSGSYVGLGVEVLYEYNDDLKTLKSLSVSRVIKNSGADEAGIVAGDYIIAVDGVLVEGNTPSDIDEVLLGEENTTVCLTIKRGDEVFDLTVTRKYIESATIYHELLDGNIGYIAITSFDENTDEYFAIALDTLIEDGAEGFIFDVRNNLGGYLDSCIGVLSELVPQGTVIATAEFKDGTVETYTSTGKALLTMPIAVLCNEYTASAGELFTAAIRDWGDEGLIDSTIIGSTTFGKGVMQSTFTYIFDYSTVTLTNAYYNPPSGENYNGVGITPDYAVGEGEDAIDTALSFIKPKIEDGGLNAA